MGVAMDPMGVAVDPKHPMHVSVDPKNPVGVAVSLKNTEETCVHCSGADPNKPVGVTEAPRPPWASQYTPRTLWMLQKT